MADAIKFVTGEWVEVVEEHERLVKGRRYYVWLSDTVNGIARLSEGFGGAYSLPGSFTFEFLARAARKVT